jgi:hypothetical protein
VESLALKTITNSFVCKIKTIILRVDFEALMSYVLCK